MLWLALFLYTRSAIMALANPTYFPTASPANNIITTVAGTGSGSYSGDGGSATSATVNSPHGIVIDSSGNVYISDDDNNRIRKITASTGIITTYVGTGTASYSGDGGLATSATLHGQNGLGIDNLGNIYIADQGNHCVRKVTVQSSIITTIAGTGSSGYNGDGIDATSATMDYPVGVALDSSANFYISDGFNNRIRKVFSSTGIIFTVAGTGVAGYSGDGGQATSAAIKLPVGINLDNSGNFYFGDDNGYNVIRKVTVATGIISTVAGTGSATGGYNGDNIAATSATLYVPHDVVIDFFGNLYISDRNNNRVRKVTVSTGIITTVVGTGVTSSSGDGSAASSATVNWPVYSRFDSAGNLYVSEGAGDRVRKVLSFLPTIQPTSVPTFYPR